MLVRRKVFDVHKDLMCIFSPLKYKILGVLKVMLLLRSSIFHWLFLVNSPNSDCLQISPSLAGGDLTASLEITPGYVCSIVPAALHFRGRMHIKGYFHLENASLLSWAFLDGPLKQNSQWCIWLQVGIWGCFCPAMQYCQECLHLNKKSLSKGRMVDLPFPGPPQAALCVMLMWGLSSPKPPCVCKTLWTWTTRLF